LGGRDKIGATCATFWNGVAKVLSDAWTEGEKDLSNELEAIRDLCVDLSSRLFSGDVLDFLFRAARETNILVISTNMIEVPWEALINPRERDGIFLSECCMISRSYMPTQGINRVFETNSDRGKGTALYVDSVLAEKWTAPGSTENQSYRKLLRGQNALSTKNAPTLFRDMAKRKTVEWICENAFDEATGLDRLRISKRSHCTRNTLLTNGLTQSTVVFLVTCCEQRPKRTHEPISALIATHNGCTVIAPLIPISEAMGIRLARIFNYLKKKFVRKAENISLETFLLRVREKESVGSPTIGGILGLFLAIYGSPRATIGD
jgi:hypothetical protein